MMKIGKEALRHLVMSAVFLASASGGVPFVEAGQEPPVTQAKPAGEPKFTLEGDTALLSVAINADKTADFERVMARVRQALEMSPDQDRRRQAAGWKVVRLRTPLPDGAVTYVHVIHPVVAGADYTIMRILYDAFPAERQALYELYRGAFARNLSLAQGTVAIDLARPATVSVESAAR
jgi:hypothetical protein